MSKTINVNVGAISYIDPSSIKTSGQYVLLEHLARGLFKSNNDGFLEGDLIEKWKISKDKKIYTFYLKDNQKWSNGDNITVKDIISFFEWQIKKGTANHTNLSTINKITEYDSNKFSIALHVEHTAFLDSINNADMKIFKIRDNRIDFGISSGAYVLKDITPQTIVVQKNHFFPDHNNSPDQIIFHNSEQSYENIKDLDFVWVLTLPDSDFIKAEKTLNFKRYTPHLLYTQWLSISPDSNNLTSVEDRKFISYQIREFSKLFINSHETLKIASDQLLWEDGIGEIPKNEILKYWKEQSEKFKEKTKKYKLKILAADYDILRFIVSKLKEAGHEVHVDWFNSYSQRVSLQEKNKYDLIYQSNDFTENDPYVSLRVTFNPHKPYITTDKDDNQFILQLNTIHTLDLQQRIPIYEDISRSVIRKAYIGPIAHFKQYYLVKNINTSFWSNSYPDFRFWKTPVIKDVEIAKN